MSGVVRYLIVGCGYVGTRLAKSLLARGPVVGLTGRPETAAALDRAGIDGFAWNLDDEAAAAPRILSMPAAVFYLAPPQPSGVHDERLARFLARLTTLPSRFVYVSTTGVYGDTGGAAVAEEAPAMTAPHAGSMRSTRSASGAPRNRCPGRSCACRRFTGPAACRPSVSSVASR